MLGESRAHAAPHAEVAFPHRQAARAPPENRWCSRQPNPKETQKTVKYSTFPECAVILY